MRKLLLAALVVPMLTSCVATRAAMANVENELLEMRATAEEMRAGTMAGASGADLAALDERLSQDIADVEAAKDALVEAAEADIANLKDAGKGLLNLGAAGDGGAIGLLVGVASWWMRDRRKKLGSDPLQLSSTKTPPTTA